MYLSQLGKFVSTGKFVFQQVSPYIAVHVVHAGAGIMAVGGREYRVQAGDVFTFFPGELYDYHDFRESPWRYTWLILEGPQTLPTLQQLGITPDHPKLAHAAFGKMELLLEEISNHYQNPTVTAPMAIASAWQAIDALSQMPSAGSAPRGIAQSAHHMIEHAIMEIISVEALADRLAVSRSTLFRAFREHYGVSPKQHMETVRLNRARRMLVESPARLKQIAAACGYASGRYFSRAFSKQFGKPPAAYRRSLGFKAT